MRCRRPFPFVLVHQAVHILQTRGFEDPLISYEHHRAGGDGYPQQQGRYRVYCAIYAEK